MNLKKYIDGIFKKGPKKTLDKSLLKLYNDTRDSKQTAYLCHAPFKSMLLTNTGKVLACCFNRESVLGIYPSQSLKEIWHGKNAQKLRQHIRNNNFDYGCFVCKNQFQNKEFFSLKARMFDHLAAPDKGYPALIEFDLDNTCNLECMMCNADNSSAIRAHSALYGKYTSPYNSSLLEELQVFIPHALQLSFAGGEPFLIKLYYQIWEKAIEINPRIKINVITNGTVLNDRIKELLEKGHFEISLSIDSIKPQTYEKIRKNAKFETVIQNLSWFHSYCRRKESFFGIWVCPLRENKYEIHEIFEHFGEQQIEVFLHTVWVPPLVSLWSMTHEELVLLNSFYNDKFLSVETETKKNNANRFEEFKKLLKQWQNMAQQREQDKACFQTVYQYETILVEIMNSQYLQKEYSRIERTEKLKALKVKISQIKSNFSEESYSVALKLLSLYPDDFIFQIFEAGSSEMITDFFMYLKQK